MERAVSFCDCMDLLTEPVRLPEGARYLYAGSCFCDRYFCGIPETCWTAAARLAKERSLELVLVLPVAGQSLHKPLKDAALGLLARYDFREAVVNDYAAFQWLRGEDEALPIWFGRLLSKDLRDPRYRLRPEGLKLYDRVCRQGEVLGLRPFGVEADLTEPVPFSPGQACRLAVHTPLAYLSAGRLCEYAGLDRPLEEKFRPGQPCRMECAANWIRYENGGLTFYKLGRAVYTPNTGLRDALEALDDAPARLITTMLTGRIDL